MSQNYRKWEPQDIDFITNNCDKMTDKAIAVTLSKITGNNISISMIRSQRRKLGLNRPKGRPKM